MTNAPYIISIVAIVALIGLFIYIHPGNSLDGNVVKDTTTSVPATSGDTQKITLSLKDYNYYPNTINVKEGQPVSITMDSKIQGCLRSFIIKDLGVRGYSQDPSQTIDFTPTQKGTFTFACSMGMGRGKIIVE